jgi:hypothetical protein
MGKQGTIDLLSLGVDFGICRALHLSLILNGVIDFSSANVKSQQLGHQFTTFGVSL